MKHTIQIAVIGAMQRAHPALTQLWLQWVGLPDLAQATFNTARAEERGCPGTSITLRAAKGLNGTWSGICDLMGVPPDGRERRTMPMLLTANADAHATFWRALLAREADFEGPLEWWWRLLVLRMHGVRAASRVILKEVFGDDAVMDDAVVRLVNPSLSEFAWNTSKLHGGTYRQPTHLNVLVRAKRSSSKWQGLEFPLAGTTLANRFIPALLDAAVTRHV